MGPERLNPVPPGEGIPLGRSPEDVGADSVVAVAQVVEGDDIHPSVPVQIGHGESQGRFSGQSRPAGLAVALRAAPVDEAGQLAGGVGVIVGHDDVQIAVLVEVGHRLFLRLVGLQPLAAGKVESFRTSPEKGGVAHGAPVPCHVVDAAQNQVQPAVGVEIGDLHRGGRMDLEQAVVVPAVVTAGAAPEDVHVFPVHVGEDQVQKPVLVEVGDGGALAEVGVQAQLGAAPAAESALSAPKQDAPG